MNPLPFIPGQIYNRRLQIHAEYGGNVQSGISTSSKYPYIFIFTGKSGAQHGYKDRWDNENVFTYSGEGQKGDMTFTKGNKALLHHLDKGVRVFLFEFHSKGFVRFVDEVEYFDFGYERTHDTHGDDREAIIFFFKRIGVEIPNINAPNSTGQAADAPPAYEGATEQKRFVTSRVGQGAYRKSIIHRWNYQCAVTGFDNLSVLVASHIHPWSSASDKERLDVENGILLSPTYDALFDRHLISFENDGRIILSDSIEPKAYAKIGVSGKETIKKLTSENVRYLELHRGRMGSAY